MAIKNSKRSADKVAQVNFLVDNERMFKKYVRYLSDPWQIMWRNFLVGTFQGLGFVLGTALLLAIIGFVFGHLLTQIPLLENFSKALDIWLKQNITSA